MRSREMRDPPAWFAKKFIDAGNIHNFAESLTMEGYTHVTHVKIGWVVYLPATFNDGTRVQFSVHQGFVFSKGEPQLEPFVFEGDVIVVERRGTFTDADTKQLIGSGGVQFAAATVNQVEFAEWVEYLGCTPGQVSTIVDAPHPKFYFGIEPLKA